MNPMQCQVKGHNGSQIIVACMNKQCKNKKLCCWQCLGEFHGSHQKQCVEIQHINTFIQQKINKQAKQVEQLSYGQKQTIQDLEWLSTLIDSLQKIILERIEKIKSQNLQEYLKKASNGQQGIEYWNQILEGILQYVEVDNCVINLKISKEGQLNQMEEQEIKFIKQSGEAIQSMTNQINQTKGKIDEPAQMKIEKLSFDENRKNASFAIIGQSTIKQIKTCRCSMAFANEGFDPRSQNYQFAFNIQNIVTQILIGVGNDKRIKESSYINNNVGCGLGHGQYMLNSYSKDTFHHTDQEFQNKQKGFEFKTGDKIQIKYDHLTKVLEFRKQSDQNAVVRMPITDMTKILYPCVYFYSEGSQVQIVEY